MISVIHSHVLRGSKPVALNLKATKRVTSTKRGGSWRKSWLSKAGFTRKCSDFGVGSFHALPGLHGYELKIERHEGFNC